MDVVRESKVRNAQRLSRSLDGHGPSADTHDASRHIMNARQFAEQFPAAKKES